MKKILILIPGARPVKSHNAFLQRLIRFIYHRFFHFLPEFYEQKLWQDVVFHGYNVIYWEWSGNIIPYDVRLESKKLKKFMDSHQACYTFITGSIGAEIALGAIDLSDNHRVDTFIALCPVARSRDIRGFSFYNIYSNFDILARFGRVLLWPGNVYKNMTGSVKNYEFPRLRHDQFLPKQRINEKQNLYDFVKELL